MKILLIAALVGMMLPVAHATSWTTGDFQYQAECQTTDWDCLIGGTIAVDGNGAHQGRTELVTIKDIPKVSPVRQKIQAAVEAIKTRFSDFAEYSAHIEGIYAVYGSEQKDEVIAYAVLGNGNDPDYDFAEWLLYAYDLSGTLVYEAIEDF